MQKILLTGFEAFNGESINPSWEAVKLLDGKVISNTVIFARQLPCVFGKAIQTLTELITEIKPCLVLNIGQAGGRLDISIERIAINIDDARIPDNAGNQPIDTTIISGAPSAYFSTLPIKAITACLRSNGIPASVSQTAGTFVCNHVFYGLMHFLNSKLLNTKGGFIHIPYLPSQAANLPGQPSMALETIVSGLEIIIVTCLNYSQDIHQSGGTIC